MRVREAIDRIFNQGKSNYDNLSLLFYKWGIWGLNRWEVDEAWIKDFGEKSINKKKFLSAILRKWELNRGFKLELPKLPNMKELGPLKVGYRLVIGMGYPSPVENGFLFHHTYGIPYIPGEALKGITRQVLLLAMYNYLYESKGVNLKNRKPSNMTEDEYKEKLLETLDKCLSSGRDKKSGGEKSKCSFEVIDNNKNKNRIDDDLFEHLEKACLDFNKGVPEVVQCTGDSNLDVLALFETLFGSQKKRGEVIFFDAFPVDLKKEHFELDIMNPHYGEYYGSKEKERKPPADWYNPNPIVFLTLANTKFKFNIAYHPLNPLDESKSNKILEIAEKLLRFALTTYGIGGKTRSGYGWFEEK